MPEERPENVVPIRSVVKAVDRGRRELLLAIRDRLIQAIDENDPRCTADVLQDLTAELHRIEKDLADLDADE